MNNSDPATFLTGVLERFSERLTEYLPNLVSALLLLLLGWVVAIILRKILHGLGRAAMAWLGRHHLLERGMKKTTLSGTVPALIGGIGYWGVLLFFAAAAIEQLGLPGLSNLLNNFAAHLPSLLLGSLIVVGGVVLGHMVSEWVSAAIGSEYSTILGKVAQSAVVIMAIIVASDQVGIQSTFLMISLGILFAAVLEASPLPSRSVQGRRFPTSSRLISLRRTYQPGDRVRIDGEEGVVQDITPTIVTIETENGQLSIPPRYSSRASPSWSRVRPMYETELRLIREYLSNHPAEAAARLAELSPSDAASILADQPGEKGAEILERMPPIAAGERLCRMQPQSASALLCRLGPSQATSLLRRLPIDARHAIVAATPEHWSKAWGKALSYREGTAGALMDTARKPYPRISPSPRLSPMYSGNREDSTRSCSLWMRTPWSSAHCRWAACCAIHPTMSSNESCTPGALASVQANGPPTCGANRRSST